MLSAEENNRDATEIQRCTRAARPAQSSIVARRGRPPGGPPASPSRGDDGFRHCLGSLHTEPPSQSPGAQYSIHVSSACPPNPLGQHRISLPAKRGARTWSTIGVSTWVNRGLRMTAIGTLVSYTPRTVIRDSVPALPQPLTPTGPIEKNTSST